MYPSDLKQETLISTIRTLNLDYAKLKQSYTELEKKEIKTGKEFTQILNVVKVISANFAKQDSLNINTLIRDLSIKCSKFKNKIHVLKEHVDNLIKALVKELNAKFQGYPEYKQRLILISNKIQHIDSLKNAVDIHKREDKKKSLEEIKNLKREIVKVRGVLYEKIIKQIYDLIQSFESKILKKPIIKKTQEIESKTEELSEMKKKRLAMFEIIKQIVMNELQNSMYKKKLYIYTI